MNISFSNRRRAVIFITALFTVLFFCLFFSQTVTRAAEKAEMKVNVKNAELLDNHQLDGSKLQLLSKDGKVMEEWTSTNKVHTLTSELNIGEEYIVHQVTPPATRKDSSGSYVPDYDTSYCIGYDVSFTVDKSDNSDGEIIHWKSYEHLINRNKGHFVTGSATDTVTLYSPRNRTLTFGRETLGSAGDKDEYFEVILTIPEGVPGQVMNADLSNADSGKNPSKLVIPESGSLKASFWLKNGQSVTLDGFPFLFSEYYKLAENNETLNREGYITHILANEVISMEESDAIIIKSINLISKDSPVRTMNEMLQWLKPVSVYAATSVTSGAIDAMNGYAEENLFDVEDPVVDPVNAGSPHVLETFGLQKSLGNAPYTINDTLTDGKDTTRSASKLGRIPGTLRDILVTENGIYGDGYVLFIDRRDAISVKKQDETGSALAGAKLQILDAKGNEVHSFTSGKKAVKIAELSPGEYKLHEKEAPKGYRVAKDVEFTVVDKDTVKVDGKEVDAVTMTDRAYVDIPVKKVWKDDNNKDGKRPDKVTVKLLADGKKKDEITLSGDNGWKGSFKDLDKYSDGKEIEYTVAEGKVWRYESSVEGDTEKGFTITNSRNSVKKGGSGKTNNVKTPGTGDSFPVILFSVLLVAVLALVFMLKRRKA